MIAWNGSKASQVVDAVWRQQCPWCDRPLGPRDGPYHRMTCGAPSCEQVWGWCPQQMRRNIMAEVQWRSTVLAVLARECVFCGQPATKYLTCADLDCLHLLSNMRVDMAQELTWILEREWPGWNGPKREEDDNAHHRS